MNLDLHKIENRNKLFELGYVIDGGILRQVDMTPTVKYDASYFEEWKKRKNSDANKRLLEIRNQIVSDFNRYNNNFVVDYGCGDNPLPGAYAFDPFTGNGCHGAIIDALKDENTSSIFCFFDSLEHMPYPSNVIELYRPDAVVVSVPNAYFYNGTNHFIDLDEFLNWKHRKYGEHLWHFNEISLRRFFSSIGYKTLRSGFPEDEIRKSDNGRPNILTMVFHNVC